MSPYVLVCTTIIYALVLSQCCILMNVYVRPGLLRLLLMIPLILLHLTLPPVMVDRNENVITLAIMSALISWWCSFKLIAFAWDRGAITQAIRLKYPTIAIAMLLVLPVTPVFQQRDVEDTRSKNSQKTSSQATVTSYAWRFITKIALLLATVHAITAYQLPDIVAHFLMAWGLYALLGGLMDGLSCVCLLVDGRVKLVPHFDQPYLSESLEIFWAKRWNRFAAGQLRSIVFDPLIDNCAVAPPDANDRVARFRRRQRAGLFRVAVATICTFAMSGIMHELVFYHLTGAISSGAGWFLFFSLNGVLVLVERAMWSRTAWYTNLPSYVRVAFTLALEVYVAELFFFKPVIQAGLDVAVIESVKETAASFVLV